MSGQRTTRQQLVEAVVVVVPIVLVGLVLPLPFSDLERIVVVVAAVIVALALWIRR